jgi:hypothetical protein
MKDLGVIIGATVLALGIITASVALLDDRSVLTSPPEAVAEGFVRTVETGRYDRALPYLDDSLQKQVGVETLRDLAHRLRSRTGTVLSVESEPVRMGRESAVASVLLKGDLTDSVRLEFPLSFSSGVWSISGLGALADTAWEGEQTMLHER